MSKIVIFAALIMSVPLLLIPQSSTFSFWYESQENKNSAIPLELSDGRIIVPINIFTGSAYSPSKIDKAFLLNINKNGDTNRYFYPIADTSFNYARIVTTLDGGFLITGASRQVDSDSVNLLMIKLNCDMEIIWRKHHYLSEIRRMAALKIFPLNDGGFIMAGYVGNFTSTKLYPYLLRVNESGEVLREKIYEFSSIENCEFMISPSGSRIWMFAYGLQPQPNGMSVTVLDTTFTYISSQIIQLTGTPPYQANWLSDTSLILSYQARKIDLPYQDEEYNIQIMDTLFNVLKFEQFGLPNAYDCPAWSQGHDHKHPDTLFYAANTDLYFGYPPEGYNNWFMVRQSNGQLEERYRSFFGGDAYYYVSSITATNDGGCFVIARKHNRKTDNFELLFLKLNSQGLLVGTSDPKLKQQMFILYPNPSSDEFVVETYLESVTITIFDSNGRMLSKYVGVKGKNVVNISSIPSGIYVVSLYSSGKLVENKKLIKK
jgi:hypothetical protein